MKDEWKKRERKREMKSKEEKKKEKVFKKEREIWDKEKREIENGGAEKTEKDKNEILKDKQRVQRDGTKEKWRIFLQRKTKRRKTKGMAQKKFFLVWKTKDEQERGKERWKKKR